MLEIWATLGILTFFGLVGAIIGKSKRSSVNAGFLWGFFLGPIGWIIAALVLREITEADLTPRQKLKLRREKEAALRKRFATK